MLFKFQWRITCIQLWKPLFCSETKRTFIIQHKKFCFFLLKVFTLSDTTTASIFRAEETMGTAHGHARLFLTQKATKHIFLLLKFLRLIRISKLINVVRDLRLTRPTVSSLKASKIWRHTFVDWYIYRLSEGADYPYLRVHPTVITETSICSAILARI